MVKNKIEPYKKKKLCGRSKNIKKFKQKLSWKCGGAKKSVIETKSPKSKKRNKLYVAPYKSVHETHPFIHAGGRFN